MEWVNFGFDRKAFGLYGRREKFLRRFGGFESETPWPVSKRTNARRSKPLQETRNPPERIPTRFMPGVALNWAGAGGDDSPG